MKELDGFVEELLTEQKCVIWFMDTEVGAIAQMALNIPAENLHSALDRQGNLLDLECYDYWLSRHSMYARVHPEWNPAQSNDSDIQSFIAGEYPIEHFFSTGWAVDLVSKADNTQLDWNRADDLIVRTTFMIQRAEPFFVDWETLVLNVFAKQRRRISIEELTERDAWWPDRPNSGDQVMAAVEMLCRNGELEPVADQIYRLTPLGRRHVKGAGA